MKFGPSGNSESFWQQGHTSTMEQPAWLKENFGLTAFEYSFGRGVRIRQDTAQALGQEFAKYEIQLSVHAPYFINLATEEEEKKKNCLRYLEESCRAAQWMGAKRIVFHPGALGKLDRQQAMDNIYVLLEKVIQALEEQALLEGVALCPETMGKIAQIGDEKEIASICKTDERLIPCIDFGHLYARRLGQFGDLNSFTQVLDTLETELGTDRAKQMHVHFSRIEYTKGGEKQHWNYEDEQYGPSFEPLAMLLAQRQYHAIIICESKGKMAEDAALFRSLYQKAIEDQTNESAL